MKTLFSLLLVAILLACFIERSQSMVSESAIIPGDTTIVYDLEGISAEGAQAVVHYVKGKIDKSEITIYGETGRTVLVYVFFEKLITVTEEKYKYKKDFSEVKSDKDIKLTKKFTYKMNIDGIPLKNKKLDRTDIFKEFKQVVPFVLKTAIDQKG